VAYRRRMSDEIQDAIESTAKGPARVRTDAGEVQSQDISKQIEADRYLASKAAASTTSRGLRFNQIIPGGFS
jgi:hypothetical protein